MRKQSPAKPSTSWQKVSSWYTKQVGEDGHYYHQQIVLPRSLRLLNLENNQKFALLDVACGQGVLERAIPTSVQYLGIDIAADLIRFANEHKAESMHQFKVGDMTKELSLPESAFTHAACILALQNMRDPKKVIDQVSQALHAGGSFLIVLNHPCFRIPRQSSWGVDETKKTQYRRIDRYMSPLEVPITAHPGKRNSTVTWSFHQPLSAYSKMLTTAGFLIEDFEEWCSDKMSEGKAAKMENRGRQEFPLFAAILARKIR